MRLSIADLAETRFILPRFSTEASLVVQRIHSGSLQLNPRSRQLFRAGNAITRFFHLLMGILSCWTAGLYSCAVFGHEIPIAMAIYRGYLPFRVKFSSEKLMRKKRWPGRFSHEKEGEKITLFPFHFYLDKSLFLSSQAAPSSRHSRTATNKEEIILAHWIPLLSVETRNRMSNGAIKRKKVVVNI
jgi:hypothetical protein